MSAKCCYGDLTANSVVRIKFPLVEEDKAVVGDGLRQCPCQAISLNLTFVLCTSGDSGSSEMENLLQNQRQSGKGFEPLFSHHELYIMKLNVNDFHHFVGNRFFCVHEMKS